MRITQSLISSFGPTRIYKPAGTETTAPSNSGGWYPSNNPVYPNTANGYYAELRVTTSSNVNLIGYQAKYQFRLYYKDELLFDTGLSNKLNRYGQPVNWPPSSNGGVFPSSGQSNNSNPPDSNSTTGYTEGAVYRDDYDDDGFDNRTYYFYKRAETAMPNFYLGPDQYFGELSYIGDTNNYSQDLRASHFLLGNYISAVSTVSMAFDSVMWKLSAASSSDDENRYNNGDKRWYYEVIKLNHPPFMYRNALCYDDSDPSSADQDYNDAIFMVKNGDAFFTGTFYKNSVNTGNGIFSSRTYNGKEYRLYPQTFVKNTDGNITFTVFRRANKQSELLLYKGNGSNEAAVIIVNGNPASTEQRNQIDRTVNLDAGTYEVGLRANTTAGGGTGYTVNGTVLVRSIDTTKYPSNMDYT